MAEEELDKKAKKKAKKEQKKAQKEAENGEEEVGGAGSKIAIAFVTLIIIVLWLAILTLLVKWDVGGFGSTVLKPILKDVPYVNKILPMTDEELAALSAAESDEYAAYQTLDEAIAQIKQLELQLQEAQQSSDNNDAHVAELEAEVARLSAYETNEAKFEEEKAKFYDEVVFNENAPDITQYQSYYESIDPENAERLYKQVVQKNEADKKIQDYVARYSNMKPKQAAAIFDTMTDNLKLVAKILQHMDTTASAEILGAMDTSNAAKITQIMEPSE